MERRGASCVLLLAVVIVCLPACDTILAYSATSSAPLPPDAEPPGADLAAADGAAACDSCPPAELCPCDDEDPCTTDDRCVDGRCVGEAVTCDEPPATSCLDAETLRSYLGRCVDGACVYEQQEQTCANGCSGAACLQCVAHTDDFTVLDPRYWVQWTGDNIALSVSGGAVNASRPAALTESWTGGSGVGLKPRVDFTGAGASVQWEVTLGAAAQWNLTYAQLLDADAARYLAFDFSTLQLEREPVINARLSSTEPIAHLWKDGPVSPVQRGEVVRFVIANPAPRTVTYEAYGSDNSLLYSKTNVFTAAEWNGIDWVTVRWFSFGWPYDDPGNPGGEPATIAASLLSVTTGCSIDAASPLVQLGGPQPGVAYAGDLEIPFGASDDESGVRCVRASWDDWPAGDGDCDAVSGSTRHPSTGDRTLYVRAWDWGGNLAERSELYRRIP